MDKLRFKDFVWPHNPTNFQITYEKKIVRHEFPDWHVGEIEDLAIRNRVFTGSGVFFGRWAYVQFNALKALTLPGTKGILSHPKFGDFTVYLSKLTSREEPLPNYIEYDFEFIEDRDINLVTKIISAPSSSGGGTSTGSSSGTRYYTVVKGDSLWKISLKYYGTGTKWRIIADANKSLIKNPNLIYPGWKLVIPY